MIEAQAHTRAPTWMHACMKAASVSGRIAHAAEGLAMGKSERTCTCSSEPVHCARWIPGAVTTLELREACAATLLFNRRGGVRAGTVATGPASLRKSDASALALLAADSCLEAFGRSTADKPSRQALPEAEVAEPTQ